MTGTMNRKSFEPGGFVYEFLDGQCRKLPDNVAYVSLGEGRFGRDHRDVTWDEVMATRRQRQADRLDRLRQDCEPAVVPCYVWTFLVPGDFFSGWYCYVVTRQFELAVNFRGFNEPLMASIMVEIPLGWLPLRESFEPWMAAFTRAYPRSRRWPGGVVRHRGEKDPRPAGTFHGWLTDRRTFSVQRPL